MASRPIFIPILDGKRYVFSADVEFQWHPGFAITQKQKNVRALHEVAKRDHHVRWPLEVSSKSEEPLGVALSSFNLTFVTAKGRNITVEAAFQGSKVFKFGGPYTDLYDTDSRSAKKDERIKNSGPLERFQFFNQNWDLEPKTAFYDWLYINALLKNPHLIEQVTDRDAFSDIEFNPDKSINCQARSLALFCALYHTDRLIPALSSQSAFLELYKGRVSPPSTPKDYGRLI